MTYSSAGNLKEVAARIPLDRILLETDAPYMKPANGQQSGTRSSSPSMIPWIAAQVADLRQVQLHIDEV